jgi:hypothetical protein
MAIPSQAQNCRIHLHYILKEYTIQIKNLEYLNHLSAGTETYNPLQPVQNQISLHMCTVLPGSIDLELYSDIDNPLTSNRLF